MRIIGVVFLLRQSVPFEGTRNHIVISRLYAIVSWIYNHVAW